MAMSGSRGPDGAGPPPGPMFGKAHQAHIHLDEMLARLLADEVIAFTYAEREKRLIWNQGETIPGLDPDIYRKCQRTGAILCYGHLGHANLRSGWDYGYVYPPEWGGLDCLSNMLPEQCEDYRPVSAGKPQQG